MEVRWTALLVTSACLYSCRADALTATPKYYAAPATPWKQWTIARRPCEGVQGETGMCMFNWECIRQEGTMLSACMDGFLLGACCKLPDEMSSSTESSTESWTESTPHTSVESSKLSSDSANATEPTSNWSHQESPEASRLPLTTTTEPPVTTPAQTLGTRPITLVSRPTTLWPFIRFPTTMKRPAVLQTSPSQSPATLSNHHRPPMASTPLVTTWMTTRPSMIFAPTRLTLRPSLLPSTATYVQRPSLQAVLANTPIGMLSSLLVRPFIRPVTQHMKLRPQTLSVVPSKDHLTTPMQSDAPTVTTHHSKITTSTKPTQLTTETTPEPFTSVAGELSSHAVSRLPPSILNDLTDLSDGIKTPHHRLTTASNGIPTTASATTISYPDFIDLTEFTSTGRPPPTKAIEYTLDFDLEDHATVTETISADADGTGRPSFGEIVDVTVAHVDSTASTWSARPSTTFRPRVTTRSPMVRISTTNTVKRGTPTKRPNRPTPLKMKPALTTGPNLIQHVTYPSKYTLRPSTVFKFPLLTKVATKPPVTTALQGSVVTVATQAHFPVAHSTVYPTGTTRRPPTTGFSRWPPLKTTLAMTASTKPKSTPKPTKPVLQPPYRPVKPTKMPLPSKSSTKKTTLKPPPSKLSTAGTAASSATATKPHTSYKPSGLTEDSLENSTLMPTETSPLRWDYRKRKVFLLFHETLRVESLRLSFSICNNNNGFKSKQRVVATRLDKVRSPTLWSSKLRFLRIARVFLWLGSSIT